jgi:N6-adenosine-specific RNA methylase IME4
MAMNAAKTIQVTLPAQAEASPEDLELLEATFRAIVTLRFQGGHAWEQVERALLACGWNVQSQLMWVAEARRGREFEQGVGATKEEAYEQLQQLTKLDEMTGVS